MNEKIAAIVLAAGRGTRINARTKNKVALGLNGRPMVRVTVDNLRKIDIDQIIAVVGFQSESVKEALGDSVDYATQDPPLGTGDAVREGLNVLYDDIDVVLSVYGDDSAFYTPDLYRQILEKRQDSEADILFLTITKDNPTGLGRIVRDEEGHVLKIVEEKNANEIERKIKEINTGLYCFDRKFLESNINKIQKNEISGEFYLTDLVEIGLRDGFKVDTLHLTDDSIWHGVNTREELRAARAKFQEAGSR